MGSNCGSASELPVPARGLSRLEIGPVPRRDRLHSGSKSVEFRAEIVVCRDI